MYALGIDCRVSMGHGGYSVEHLCSRYVNTLSNLYNPIENNFSYIAMSV